MTDKTDKMTDTTPVGFDGGTSEGTQVDVMMDSFEAEQDFLSPLGLQKGGYIGEHRNYHLERKLGEGGMGQIWLAEEIQAGRVLRHVVCKIVPQPVQSSSCEMEHVVNSFELMQHLNHTNICPVYGMFNDPVYGWFFVMDYADGGTLEDWFLCQPGHETGLSVEQILPILKPVAEALDYAHSMNVVHRDVKPLNIMFANRAGRQILWLLDFGIAAQIHEANAVTMRQCARSGTLTYMAPEQCLGEMQNGRTDQYALGVIAYQFLSGKVPFVGVESAIVNQILKKTPPSLPGQSPAVNAVLQKVLAKNMNERFASCHDFVSALQHALSGVGDPISSDCANVVPPPLPGEIPPPLPGEIPPPLPGEIPPPLPSEVPPLPHSFAPARHDFVGSNSVQRLTVEGVEFPFCWCPPGRFLMGSSFCWNGGRGAAPSASLFNEFPHWVTLSRGFWLLATPVTVAMYRVFVTCTGWKSVGGVPHALCDRLWKPTPNISWQNPGFPQLENSPVTCVSWDDSMAFCNWFGGRIHRFAGLPSESQWEYACRAGTNGSYSGTGKLEEMGWNVENSALRTQPVCHKLPNQWNLYDMHGNVMEWCYDWCGNYSQNPLLDPIGPGFGQGRVIRGGSWNSLAVDCRSSARCFRLPKARSTQCGFRVLFQEN